MAAKDRMNTVVVTAHVDAPRESVFAAITDPHKPFLTNNPVTRLEIPSRQKSGIGTIYLWIFTLPLGLQFKFDEVVSEWVEPERLAYRAICGWKYGSAGNTHAGGWGNTGDIHLALSRTGPVELVDAQMVSTPGYPTCVGKYSKDCSEREIAVTFDKPHKDFTGWPPFYDTIHAWILPKRHTAAGSS